MMLFRVSVLLLFLSLGVTTEVSCFFFKGNRPGTWSSSSQLLNPDIIINRQDNQYKTNLLVASQFLSNSLIIIYVFFFASINFKKILLFYYRFTIDSMNCIRFSLEETSSKFSREQERKRYSTLHKAVQQHKIISDNLGLRLFEFVSKNKKEMEILIRNRMSSRGKENNGGKGVMSRELRRQALGLQSADLQNYRNKTLGKFDNLKKRKTAGPKKNKFEVSSHVKKKFNIKGFAAKIDHNLGKRKTGIKDLTKMINISLVKL